MKQDLLQHNPHDKSADLSYKLTAYDGYTAEDLHRGVSAAQYGAILHILNQPDNRYIYNEGGIEVTLLFTAQDTSGGREVAVYIDGQSEIATCPLDEFRAEFSRIQAA